MNIGTIYKFHNRLWIMITTINAIFGFFLLIITIFLSDQESFQDIRFSGNLIWGFTYIFYMVLYNFYHRYKLINLDFNNESIVFRYKIYDFIIGIIDSSILIFMIYLVNTIKYLNVLPYTTIFISSVSFIIGVCPFIIYMIVACTCPALFEDESCEHPINDLIMFLKRNTKPISCDSKCSICLENYETNTKQIQLTCNHYFHEICITEWLSTNDTPSCPLYRTEQAIDV